MQMYVNILSFLTTQVLSYLYKIGCIILYLLAVSILWLNKFNNINQMRQKDGLNRDLNPGPPAPKAGIIPLDHWATYIKHLLTFS
jgi:hypothetical protein